MAMDFFEHQAQARKNTGYLVFLFILATIVIMAMVYIATSFFVNAMDFYTSPSTENNDIYTVVLWNPKILGISILCTLVIVAMGSLYKISQLRGGGSTIATMMGGRLIDPGSTSPQHRKILNVVEEMAIASGVPVPPVYIMTNEQSINAFAAGFSPNDAVIGVTRGCVDKLSRDELQGVIAHEFSHILNGDMRLNIRLIGIIHGILVIGLIGYAILRSMLYGRMGHVRTGNRKGGGAAVLLIPLFGLTLIIIGFAGVFFGNLIKAAVSRQREYLADASAVQFTRNPHGIAGALKKIGGIGSHLASPKADEISHMFFGQALASAWLTLMATHPPLIQRIRRIDPQFDGRFNDIETEEPDQYGQTKASLAGAAANLSGLAAAPTESMADRIRLAREKQGGRDQPVQHQQLRRSVEQIGSPTLAHLAYANALISEIPEPVKAGARESYGSRAVVYALLLDQKPEVREAQFARLAVHADPEVYKLTQQMVGIIDNLDQRVRLPLLDMTVPALSELASGQYRSFKQNVAALIAADEQVDLFEWTVRRMILHRLEPRMTGKPRIPEGNLKLRGLRNECATLLSILARVGHGRDEHVTAAINQSIAVIKLPGLNLEPAERCTMAALDKALDTLQKLHPLEKRKLINACITCISADRQVTIKEAELLRGIADSLDCPIPPLLPGQSTA